MSSLLVVGPQVIVIRTHHLAFTTRVRLNKLPVPCNGNSNCLPIHSIAHSRSQSQTVTLFLNRAEYHRTKSDQMHADAMSTGPVGPSTATVTMKVAFRLFLCVSQDRLGQSFLPPNAMAHNKLRHAQWQTLLPSFLN
jgi:hypothetical protein